MKRVLLSLLTVVLIAGCTEPVDLKDETTPPVELPIIGPDIDNITFPNGQNARDFIDTYIMKHPNRRTNAGGMMDVARDDLVKTLEGFGLRVERQEYETGVNILAFIDGTHNPDQWVVLSAHYDSAISTVYGAWDDGAGVATLMELGHALAKTPFPFTVVLAFFDQEESGLIGSQNFVKIMGNNDTVDIVANLNTDPPGLNWPCGDAAGHFPVKIIHELGKVEDGEPRFVLLYDAIEHGLNATMVPAEVRDYTPGIPIAQLGGQGLRGTSDHASFGKAEIANVFLGGTPTTTAGPASALTYALHTPLDTLQQMEARCTGGKGTLADGLQTIGSTLTHALLYLSDTYVAKDPSWSA